MISSITCVFSFSLASFTFSKPIKPRISKPSCLLLIFSAAFLATNLSPPKKHTRHFFSAANLQSSIITSAPATRLHSVPERNVLLIAHTKPAPSGIFKSALFKNFLKLSSFTASITISGFGVTTYRFLDPFTHSLTLFSTSSIRMQSISKPNNVLIYRSFLVIFLKRSNNFYQISQNHYIKTTLK